MGIGYACKVIGVTGVDMRSCLMRSVSKDKLMELIKYNLVSLNRIIDYNIENNIKLFRISSDLIPFGSSCINSIRWWEHFSEEFRLIGQKIKEGNMRVSLHPGQYTVLNSVNNDVVKRAIGDLIYHTRILDCLGLDSSHKIILHIGGVYNDKNLSIKRFIQYYNVLDDRIKKRLVIENDDKSFSIQDVLEIGMKLNIPVVFDNLHNEINSATISRDEFTWIKLCKKTWNKQDGRQKIHYSQQSKHKKKGSHSDFINIGNFMNFYNKLNSNDIDIMLEVKDKNLSCVKCINCLAVDLKYSILKKEWGRYRYTVLERSPYTYLKIIKLFKENNDLAAISFYKLIDQGLESPGNLESYIKALKTVWNYFDIIVTIKEKDAFIRNLNKFQQHQVGINVVKGYLKRLAIKYKKCCLLDSFYFFI